MDTLNRRLRASDSVVYAELGEEAVLLNIENGTYFGLDAVGARIWQLLGAGTDEEETVQTLQAEYDANVAVLHKDVKSFLALLSSNGLVQSLEG